MTNYFAVIHKDQTTDYGASFPDFPGCITAGKSIDELKKLSAEALTGHVETMREFGEKIPLPSKMDQIIADPDYTDAFAYLVVTIPDVKPKTVKVSVTFAENTLQQIDITAKKRGMSRSSFLAHAARNSVSADNLQR